MQDVLRFVDGGASLVVDLRYFPLCIFIWHGNSTLVLVEEYIKTRAACDTRARAEKTKLIVVTDLANAGAPPATVRKAIAEGAAILDKSEAMHSYVTCVPNSLLRGVVTALQWVAGEQSKPNKNVASMMLGIRHALQEYETMGLKVPDVDPNAYAPPPAKAGPPGKA
jgi:hypothetical protein